MLRICTLAVGKKYEILALQLRASLPIDIAIYDEESLPDDAIPFPPKKGFNFNCKRVPIEREYHPAGTLFLDADTTCVNQDSFRLFLAGLTQLPAGIHAVHSYNAYGQIAPVHEGRYVSGLSFDKIRKEKLTRKVAFFTEVLPIAEDDLPQMVFPVEWFLFCKFQSERQKKVFFDRWRALERALLDSDISYLGGESYLIGIAARYSGLEIQKLNITAALNHKNIRTI